MAKPESCEIAKTLSPFERMAKHFGELQKPLAWERGDWSIRGKILSDGTFVKINIGSRWGLGIDIEQYSVEINNPFPLFGIVDKTKPSFTFSIDKDSRLKELYTHQFVKIGSAELIMNKSLISEDNLGVVTEQSKKNAEAREEAGRALANWLDEILTTDKFTKPPVSISLW